MQFYNFNNSKQMNKQKVKLWSDLGLPLCLFTLKVFKDFLGEF